MGKLQGRYVSETFRSEECVGGCFVCTERLPISVMELDDPSIPAVATNALFTVKDSALPSEMAMMPPLRDLCMWSTLPAKYVFVRDAAHGWTAVALESRIVESSRQFVEML